MLLLLIYKLYVGSLIIFIVPLGVDHSSGQAECGRVRNNSSEIGIKEWCEDESRREPARLPVVRAYSQIREPGSC